MVVAEVVEDAPAAGAAEPAATVAAKAGAAKREAAKLGVEMGTKNEVPAAELQPGVAEPEVELDRVERVAVERRPVNRVATRDGQTT